MGGGVAGGEGGYGGVFLRGALVDCECPWGRPGGFGVLDDGAEGAEGEGG